MSHVFISYARGDSDFAAVIKARLEDAHLAVWLDTRAITAGSDWGAEIDRALDEAIAVVLVMSPEAKASEHVAFEWAYALGANVNVIPVLYRETELHPRLARMQHLDFTHHSLRPWAELLDRLAAANAQTAYRARKLPRDAPESVRRAFAALDSPEYKPRRQAIGALAQSSHPTARVALELALDHALLDVRAQAAGVLADMGDVKCIPALLALFEDDDWGDDAARDLARLGEPAIEPLLAVLRDPAQGVIRRHLAAVALVRTDIPEAQEAARGWCRATCKDAEDSSFRRGASVGVSIYSDAGYRGFVRAALTAPAPLGVAAGAPPELQRLELAATVHHWRHAVKAAKAMAAHAIAIPLWVVHPDGPDIELSIAFAKQPTLSDADIRALCAPPARRNARVKRAKPARRGRRAAARSGGTRA
jgi:HEAT repeat protein